MPSDATDEVRRAWAVPAASAVPGRGLERVTITIANLAAASARDGMFAAAAAIIASTTRADRARR
jgi:hypothetical protein